MINIRKIVVSISALALLLAITVHAGEEGPEQASKTDKCPVCGMFVYKYPDWIAQINFKDGTAVFFDGCKDLFKYYLNPGKYDAETKIDDIEAIYVNDYYRMEAINAYEAYYVAGSDVYGPMGHELIPLAASEDAEGFKKDHNGTRILKFSNITQEVIAALD